ncbi:MAG: AI-2E family transporter [Oscillospiraceae bacterium]|nr:AI-2E family transporter [Oscillospiraceae bacterium]
MTKQSKQLMLIITYAVLLLAVVLNIQLLLPALRNLWAMVSQVFVGLIAAFVLNVPMSGVERGLNTLAEKRGRKAAKGTFRGLSLLITLLVILLVIVLVFTLVIPELVSSVRVAGALIHEKMPEIQAFLASMELNADELLLQLDSINWEELLDQIMTNAGSVADSVIGVATTTVGAISVFLVAFVIAVYILLSKETLGRQAKKLLYSVVKPAAADSVCRVGGLISETYSRFLGGQCVEACILAGLMFVVFSVVGLPYAGLVAVMAGICSFIPYVGAFIACAVGAVLTLLNDPFQAVICVVVYLVVQFVENQFIYPRVVGSSVGLSPLLTLLAVLVGGQLMGVVGMIFFIPLVSVLYSLISEFVHRRLADRGLKIE